MALSADFAGASVTATTAANFEWIGVVKPCYMLESP